MQNKILAHIHFKQYIKQCSNIKGFKSCQYDKEWHTHDFHNELIQYMYMHVHTHYAYVCICASVCVSIWQDCGDGLPQSVGGSTVHAAERFIAKLWCVKCTHIIAEEQHCLELLFQHLLWKRWTTNTHLLTHVGTCAHVHVHSLINKPKAI